MGINVIDGTTAGALTTIASTHCDGITSGDFLYYTDGGPAWPISKTATISQINGSATAGITALVAYNNGIAGNNYGNVSLSYDALVELGNGVIAQVYTGDGTTGNTGVNVSYYIQETTAYTAQATTVVATTVSIGAVKIAKLTSTTFVVAWTTTSGTGTYNFRIYNNDGTAVTAATLISNIAGGSPINVNMQVLGNSDIVFVYQKVTTGANTFSRYNSSGVLQGSETTIGTGTSLSYVTILSHSSGDFWIYYRATGWRFSRYNSSGVLQGSETVIRTNALSGTAMTLNWNSAIKELSNGNVLMWATQAASPAANPIPYTYTSAGVLAVTGTAAVDGNAQTVCPEIIVESGYFYAFGPGISPLSAVSGFSVVKYTNALVAEFATGLTSPIAGTTNSGAPGIIRAFRDGSNFYAYEGAIVNTPVANIGLIAYDANFTAVGTRLLVVSTTNALSGVSCIFTSKGYLVSGGSNSISTGASPNVGYGVQNPCRRSMIGVAANTAAPGANVVIQTQGVYTINNSPVNPGSYDTRTATPAGSKGLIVGPSAILYGTA